MYFFIITLKAFLVLSLYCTFKKIITKHHQIYWNKTKYSFCLSYKINSTNEEYETPIATQLKEKLNKHKRDRN